MYRKTAFLGVLLAFAMLLSYVESLVPFYFWAPGIKLGLGNLAVVLALYLWSYREALVINVLRIMLTGFLFGNLYMILYGLAGGVLSFVVMCLVKRVRGFSLMGVSMCGGVSHNVGQFLVAFLVSRTKGLLFYAPALLTGGVVTGLLIGLIAGRVLEKIRRAGGGIDDSVFKR